MSEQPELRVPSDGASLEELVLFGREGFLTHPQNRDELIKRRELLLNSKYKDETVILREATMLSAHADDMETVDVLIKRLQAQGDPAMGYFVYKALEEKQDRDGEGYLSSAAELGYLPAQKVLALRAARASSCPNFIALTVARLKHSVKVFRIAKENDKDLRLR